MSMQAWTRTVHTIRIELTDSIMAAVEDGDDVEIVFVSSQSKNGKPTRPIKLSYGNVAILRGDS